jgi:hypothetical membrane protein
MREMSRGSTQPACTQRLLAICGIIGPILFAIVVIILGLLRPGYDHITQSISELGEAGGPNAIIMNTVGFALLGVLMIAFAFGLHRGINGGRGSKIGPALVALGGAALVMAGIFHCDPAGVDTPMVGITHYVFMTIYAFAMILAPLAICPRLKRDRLWQSYVTYSLITVVVAGAISALFVITVYVFDVFEPWKGILQRVSMVVPPLWMEVVAIRLLRLS